VDQSSGTWTEISTSNYQPTSGGGAVYAVVMHPTNKFLYESQQASSFVNIWTRDPNSGLITPAAPSPFQTGALTTDVSMSPNGRYLFVPQYEVSHVMAYGINTDGSLTALPSSPLQAGNAPGHVVVDPQDRFLFVLNTGAYNGGPPTVQAFKLDSSSGQITPVANSTFTVYSTGQLVMDANGKFLYGLGTQQTMGWSIDQSTGALTPLSGSPFPSTGIAGLILKQQGAAMQ
jgi:6-phosphogluconolactonase (cycloisomerase 2 family)